MDIGRTFLKSKLFNTALLLLPSIFVVLVFFVLFLAPPSPTDIAQDWTKNNTDSVKATVAGYIVPTILSTRPMTTEFRSTNPEESKQYLRDNFDRITTWSYAEPRNLGNDSYEVTATAITRIDEIVLNDEGVTQEFRVPFRLTVNMEAGEVTSWNVIFSEAAEYIIHSR